MEIIFTRSRNRWNQTIATRLDGVRVRVPVFGPLDPIPHDLAHYVIERALGLHDGFWGRVAAGALFGGMSVVNGRQKPHAGERSRALIAANPYAIGFAEVIVGAVLHAVKGEALGPEALAIASPVAPGPSAMRWWRGCAQWWRRCARAGVRCRWARHCGWSG